MEKDKLIEKIKKALSKQPVRLAYLYGSFATGNVHKESDVDIAVVLEPNTDKADYQIAGEIHSEVGGGLPEIDVREINLNSDPTFLANVLSPAKPIYVKDERERISFETKAYQSYYDSVQLNEINYYYIKKRVKEDKYGRGIPLYQKTS